MNIKINKRSPNSQGMQRLRLAYYYGSDKGEDGKTRIKRHYEPLDLYVYHKPKNQAERQHNKEMMRQAEAARAARQVEAHGNKFQLENRIKTASSFFDFYDRITEKKKAGSASNHANWVSAGKHLRRYHGKAELTFEEIDEEFLEGFKQYLLSESVTKSQTKLSQNTVAAYFGKVRSALNEAYSEGIIRQNPAQKVGSVKGDNTKRVYLTVSEMKRMAEAECRYPVLKRAFLFSCQTGLRWSDIQKLKWKEIEQFGDGHYRIIFEQQKIKNSASGKSLLYLDLSDDAVELIELENRGDPEDRVFKGLKYSSYTNVALLQWALRAGVEKHVTFHAGRHSFAVALLSRGVSIYQVSRLLGHSELRTTEIYSDILDEDRTRTMRFLVPRILSEEDEPETTNSCPHCGHPLEVAD